MIQLPYNTEYENSVLGFTILNPRAWKELYSSLESSDFYSAHNKAIFDTIISLGATEDGNFDLTLIWGEIKNNYEELKITPKLLADMMDTACLSELFPKYLRKIKEISIQRKLLLGLLNLPQKLEGVGVDDFFKLLEEHQKQITDSINAINPQKNRMMVKIGDEVFLKRMKERLERNEIQRDYVESFLHHINHFNRGYIRGELQVLLGQPGVGKTTFAIEEVTNASYQGHCAVLFSVELSDIRVFLRLLKLFTGLNGIESDSDRERFVEFTTMAKSKLNKCYVYHEPILTVHDIDMQLSYLTNIGVTPDIVVVDHYHVLSPRTRHKSKNEEQEEISNDLSYIARKYNVALLALAHPPKNLFERILGLGGIKGSGAIAGSAKFIVALSPYSDKQITELNLPTPFKKDYYLRFSVLKANEGEEGDRTIAYNWGNRRHFTMEQYRREVLGEVPEREKARLPYKDD